MSEEERERRRQVMLERVARGEVGGAKFGRLGGRGNTREKRLAQERLAQEAQKPEVQKDLVKVLKDAIHEDQSIGTRLKGLEAWVEIERNQEKLNLAVDKAEAEHLDRQQMIEVLRQKLTTGAAGEILRAQAQLDDPDIVDAEVVD